MEICGETDELDIFDSSTVSELLEFKWTTYASKIHFVGLTSHILYVVVFSFYVNECYVYQWGNLKSTLEIVIILCLVYPFCYDMTQLRL